jgi:hypothetical protein
MSAMGDGRISRNGSDNLDRGSLLWTIGTSCAGARTSRSRNRQTACHSRPPSRHSSGTKHLGRGPAVWKPVPRRNRFLGLLGTHLLRKRAHSGRAWLGETTLAATTPGRGHRFARPILCARRLRNGFLTEDERGAFIAHPPAPAYHQHHYTCVTLYSGRQI